MAVCRRKRTSQSIRGTILVFCKHTQRQRTFTLDFKWSLNLIEPCLDFVLIDFVFRLWVYRGPNISVPNRFFFYKFRGKFAVSHEYNIPIMNSSSYISVCRRIHSQGRHRKPSIVYASVQVIDGKCMSQDECSVLFLGYSCRTIVVLVNNLFGLCKLLHVIGFRSIHVITECACDRSSDRIDINLDAINHNMIIIEDIEQNILSCITCIFNNNIKI